MINGTLTYINITYHGIYIYILSPLVIGLCFVALSLFNRYSKSNNPIVRERALTIVNFVLVILGSAAVVFNFWFGLDLEKVAYPRANFFQKQEEEAILMHLEEVMSKRPIVAKPPSVKPDYIQFEPLSAPVLDDVRFSESVYGKPKNI